MAAGTGTALAAAPTNTKAPTVSPTPPHLGSKLTVNTGEWTGSPTFTYQWFRGGSMILGATEPTYTVTEADFGTPLRVWVTGTNSEGSKTVDVSTPVVTARLAMCRPSATLGVFKDANCSQAGGGPEGYRWLWWPAGGNVKVSGNGEAAPTYIIWEWSGVLFETDCTNMEGTAGAFENGSGATLKNYDVTLTGCTVQKPAANGCKVVGGKIDLNPVEGQTISQGLSPQYELKPKSEYGGVLGTIGFENCSSGFLNINYPMNNASLYGQFAGPLHKFVLEQKTLTMQGMTNAKFGSGGVLTEASTGSLATLAP